MYQQQVECSINKLPSSTTKCTLKKAFKQYCKGSNEISLAAIGLALHHANTGKTITTHGLIALEEGLRHKKAV